MNNFPSGFNVNNFPATQAVSGTVGIDQSNNGVKVNNFPATQAVSGSVSISGTPSVTNGDVTHLITDNFVELTVGGSNGSPDIDVSAYKTVTMYVVADASGINCTAQYLEGANLYTLDQFSVSTTGTVETFDPAPTNLDLTCTNSGTTPTGVSFDWDGRAN